MIKYSHVALIFNLQEKKSDADIISDSLGIQPTEIRESKIREGNIHTKEWNAKTTYSWFLNSDLGAEKQPIERLNRLIEIIEPHSKKIKELKTGFSPWIDILFHVTPQHPHGVSGEFDWITYPHETMRRISNMELNLSHESIWFDHPEWTQPSKSWWKRLLNK